MDRTTFDRHVESLRGRLQRRAGPPTDHPGDGAAPAASDDGALLEALVEDLRSTLEELRQREAELRAIFEGSAMGIALVGLDGRPVHVNPAVERLLGYTTDELRGMVFTEFSHPEDVEPGRRLYRELVEGKRDQYQIEKRYCRKDGTPIWADLLVSLIRDAEGRPLFALAVAGDITERKRAEEVLRQREARFRSLVQSSSDIIAVHDAVGVVRYVSPAVERVLGYRPEEVIGTEAAQWLHGDDSDEAGRRINAAVLEPRQPAAFDSRVRHRDGSWRYFELVATNLLDEPEVGGIVVNARDITERKRLEEQLTRQAFYDALTSLPNRALFTDRLDHALSAAVRREASVAVLFLDLDGFKVINDSLGHGSGDALLSDVARRLEDTLRPYDTVARFGGDEFTILLEDVAHPSDAVSAAERIIAALQEPFALDNRKVYVTTSIGIALRTPAEGPACPADLIRQADIALYQAKAAGKGRAVIFDATMNARAVERLELETGLHRAIEHGELRVYQQPEVDLTSGAIVGMEALVRWQHPERGLLAPADFIGLAEETGLIVPLGRWVLEEACHQARTWQPEHVHGHPLTLSVNLCARQLEHPDLPQEVAEILANAGLDPTCLRLEITERVLMENGTVTKQALEKLKALGVRLAIDDFGTGYSSLSYLRRFPVDILKLDQSFTAALATDDGTAAIIRAVTTLAHDLGIEVTAEGIETAEQRARLEALRCDRGQGFYFSKPLPSSEIGEVLERGRLG